MQIQLDLSDSQIEILKVLNLLKDEKDLKEVKALLLLYLSEKVVREADRAFDERGYTDQIFEKWKSEHFRSVAKT